MRGLLVQFLETYKLLLYILIVNLDIILFMVFKYCGQILKTDALALLGLV